MPEGRAAMLSWAFSLGFVRTNLVVSALIGLGLCASPLLGVQGYESALVLGVVLPLIAAPMTVAIMFTLRESGRDVTRSGLLEAALVPALAVWALPCALLLLNALRVRNCTPGLGAAFMLLGPGLGVMLAAVVGVAAAIVSRSRRTALWLALAFPLGGILLALARFYTTPAIFAYGHFFGYFSGTLYDEGIAITPQLGTLRAITSLWILGLLLLTMGALDATKARATWSAVRRHRFGTFVGVALCVTAAGGERMAAPLGHASSVAQIREALGGEHTSQRCELVFPRELSKPARQRLAADCDFRVVRSEAWLGVTHPERIRVFVFRSADEKAALMGAAHTNIAKPWRAEVYLTHAPWPHPVLWHELVHVVAARIGRGPFRIAGKLGGLWPDAALIEGVAVAAAWQPQGGLTPHEWARALLELQQLPPTSALFGLGFLGQPQRMAYTLSGSLLRFVAERHGSAVVRHAYMSGDLAAAVGQPMAALEASWRAYLQTLPMSPRTLALATARFSGKSIFSTVCPHALATLRSALRADLTAGDETRALSTCREILDIDPTDAETRASLVALHARLGQDAQAREVLDALLAPDHAQAALAALAKQALADEVFRRGDRARAAALYGELLREPVDEDALRSLQVKALAASGDDAQARVLFDLLVGAPGERADPATAVHLARELRALRSDGLAHYLEGRQLLFQERFARASTLLTTALQLGLPSPELTREAERTAGLAAFAAGDLAQAERWFSGMARDEARGRAADGEDWLARIRFTQKVSPRHPL